MNLPKTKKLLWTGIGAKEHCLTYSQQVSCEYEHVVVENFEPNGFRPNDFHCCFVFSGVVDQHKFNQLESLEQQNVFKFFDGRSVVDARRSHPIELMALTTNGFSFFTNDSFVNICLDFDLITYQYTSCINQNKQQTSPLTLINNSIEEINVWTKSAGCFCEINAYHTIEKNKSVVRHFEANDLADDYVYIAGITPTYLIQIFYPFSEDESVFRQYLTAMARRLGAAKTLNINNTHKPLHKLLSQTDKQIDMFHVMATAKNQSCSVYIILKERF